MLGKWTGDKAYFFMNAEADLSQVKKLYLKPSNQEMIQCQPLFPGSKSKRSVTEKTDICFGRNLTGQGSGGKGAVMSS